MLTNSLANRFVLIFSLWSVIALVVTAFLLAALYKNNAEKNFQELLAAHLYNLMGAVDQDQTGKLSGQPNLGDPLFIQPLSGWYWSVEPEVAAFGPSKNQHYLRSISLSGEILSPNSTTDQPYTDGFLRYFPVVQFQGQSLSIVEAKIFLGEGDQVFRFLVSGNNSALEQKIREFTLYLAIFLALFGLAMVVSTFVMVKVGLRPLSRARHALNEVRNGNAEQLEGSFPDEITPLITEMNALIAANQSVLERARTQVGNLAHALKTPISVLLNEARSASKDLPEKVEQQAKRMQQDVQRYLDRARIAAQTGSIRARTPVGAVVERMIRVMQRLNPQLKIEYSPPDKQLVFKGEQQDLEEVLGNLIENACKFANSKVIVHVTGANTEPKPVSFEIRVEDDGPGLRQDQHSDALKRGKRLDETRSGSGLGLSIVSDIVAEYQGVIVLADSDLGGLQVRLQLPLAD